VEASKAHLHMNMKNGGHAWFIFVLVPKDLQHLVSTLQSNFPSNTPAAVRKIRQLGPGIWTCGPRRSTEKLAYQDS
jgi:hypothetical protein